MIRVLGGICLLAACSNRPSPRQFISGVDASVMNGFWSADERDDAGRAIGIVIFDLPDGPRWSPHGLLVEKSFVYVTHDCRDFEVDAMSGIVRPVRGINPLGQVLYSDGGTAASLLWNPATRDWWAVLGPDYSGLNTVLYVTFDGGTVLKSAAELELSYDLTYFLSLPNGMYPPDGSVITDVVSRSMALRRRSACP